jgi:hypothetical protein
MAIKTENRLMENFCGGQGGKSNFLRILPTECSAGKSSMQCKTATHSAQFLVWWRHYFSYTELKQKTITTISACLLDSQDFHSHQGCPVSSLHPQPEAQEALHSLWAERDSLGKLHLRELYSTRPDFLLHSFSRVFTLWPTNCTWPLSRNLYD